VFDPAKPHNDLPKLPPGVNLESERVLKRLVTVRGSLAALKQAGSSIPDQSVVLQSMILQEAKLSSEIENVFTTHDELYRQIDESAALQSPAVKEIRRYKQALWLGYEQLAGGRPVDVPLIHRLASEILEQDARLREQSGTVVGNPRTQHIVYRPPHGRKLIRSLLDNLLTFVSAESEIDPLVRIAAAHYQFEAIHPFPDGNGRVGRVLNLLWMVQEKLLDLPVLFLSHEFLESRREYYALIQGVTEHGRWEEWVLYFLDCVDTTAIITRRQFDLIEEAIRSSQGIARQILPRTFPVELIRFVYSKPYTRISDVVLAGIAHRETASKYLHQLAEAGILKPNRKWKDLLFLNPRLLDILSLQSFDES
jgi:Fic family protein